MADDSLQELDARGKELASRSQEIQQTFSEIRSGLGSINKLLGQAGEEAIEFRRALNSVENTTSKLNQLQSQYLESNKGTRKVQDELARNQVAASKLREAQAVAEQKMRDARDRGEGRIAIKYARQAVNLKNAAKEADGVSSMLGKMVKESQHLDKNTKFFGQLSNVVKSIPGLKGFSEPFQRAETSARAILADGGNAAQAFTAGAKEFGSELNKFASATFVKGFFEVSKNSSNLAKQLNTSTQESLRVERSFRDIANSSEHAFVNTKNLVAATGDLNSQLGLATTFTADISENFVALTKRLDISTDSATNLVKLSAISGKSLEEQTEQIIGQVEAFKLQTGVQIDNRAVLEDIGKINAATLLTMQNQGIAVGAAASEVRRLGLNFQMLETTAQGLLNFETSISKELEAELITGKELNLERARLAALTGDQVTLAKEISRQFKSSAEFTSQSTLAQDAQAAALNMTRQQVTEMLITREALLKIGVKDEEAAKLKFDRLVKEHGYTKAIAMLGDEQYAKQLRNQDIQEKFNDLIIRLQGLIVSLVDGPMGGLLTLLESVINGANSLFGFLSKGGEASETLYGTFVKLAAFFTKITKASIGTAKSLASWGKYGKSFAKSFLGIGKVIKNITKLGGALGKVMKIVGKFGKTIGKIFGIGLLKKIPGIGLIIGVLQAVSRWQSGDKAGALMALTSGIASTIPGVGTAVSVAIDAADIATTNSDFRKGNKDKNEMKRKKSVNAEDFTINTHPKDTLKIVGGTQLNKEELKLLEKISQGIEAFNNKEAKITMNGNTVGIGVALAANKSG